jgi:hypothetical protein
MDWILARMHIDGVTLVKTTVVFILPPIQLSTDSAEKWLVLYLE